ncbi:MAG: hypothetical protein WBM98_04540 [Maribacter sp.]|uniref:hypothetical protein n=1 Tax=Maribacter sp. TaxID=1897614 RepID=UPI003C7840F3
MVQYTDESPKKICSEVHPGIEMGIAKFPKAWARYSVTTQMFAIPPESTLKTVDALQAGQSRF